MNLIDQHIKERKQLLTTIVFILVGLVYLFLEHTDFYVEILFTFLFLSAYVKLFWNNRVSILNSIWLLGNSISWIFFYLVLRYAFSGISDSDFLRPYLFNVYVLGLILSNVFFIKKRTVKVKLSIQKNDILFVISLLVMVLYIVSGGLNARDLGYEYASQFNGFYFVQAFLFFFYLVSITAGYYFGFNIYVLLFLSVLVVNYLGQHRGEFIANSLFFIVGIMLNSQRNLLLKYLMPLIVIVGISVVFLSIGSARLQQSDGGDISSLEFNLQRIIEPSGQVVLDQVYEQGKYDKFENFSRILTMPIPAFLLSGKPNNDDSNEVLNDKFGYHDLGEMTSIPIPFIADGYRRFGALGVFAFTFLIGLMFNVISLSLLQSKRAWAIPLYLILGLYALKLYPNSVLGTISFFLYVVVKFYLILSLVYSGLSFRSIYNRIRGYDY